jgi:hypothetical protein
VEVPHGFVIFNVDVKQGSTWNATFPEPKAYPLSIWLAKRTNDQGRWPQDFTVLQTSTQAVVRDVGDGPARLHEMTWTADADARYYFFAQAGDVDRSKIDTSSPEKFLGSLMITPLYEQVSAKAPSKTPLGLDVLALALVGGALLAARRRPRL